MKVTAPNHGYIVGDALVFTSRPRWWARLWRWVTRYKEPAFRVVDVSADTMQVELE